MRQTRYSQPEEPVTTHRLTASQHVARPVDEVFAFFAEPMAGREPGPFSMSGLFSLFGGVLLSAAASLLGGPKGVIR